LGLINLFGKKKEYEPAEIYLDLRKQALSLTEDQIPSLLDPSIPIICVLMESGHDDVVVTLVTVADGSVSLYFSNGGGMIGMGEHEEPRKACLDFLSFANQFVPEATLTSKFPLPAKGYTTFYFVTKSGIRSLTAKENDLEKKRLPFFPLLYKAHEVITQARLMHEEILRNTEELLHAATTGDETRMMGLLGEKINLNNPDSSGLTPLMAGAYSGHARILKLLLDKNATIDQKDSSGYTALMFASNSGKFDCVKLLIEQGANIHEEANDGSTPIMFSAQHGYDDIVRFLLSKGADPNKKGKHGLSAIGFAKQNGLTETELILEGKK
jgi:hypothetical protein